MRRRVGVADGDGDEVLAGVALSFNVGGQVEGVGLERLPVDPGAGDGAASDGRGVVPVDLAGRAVVGVEAVARGGAGQLAAAAAAVAAVDRDRAVALHPAAVGHRPNGGGDGGGGGGLEGAGQVERGIADLGG